MNRESKTKLSTRPSQSDQWDEVYRRISWWDADKIQQAKVMVIGAGALGNEVLKNLALLNIGYILIVDFDHIEYSNLSRSLLFRAVDCDRLKAEVAAERIVEMNPNVKVQYIAGDIGMDVGLGVFKRMDVIIGCLDNRIARLYLNRHCFKVNKTWVDGAIENLAGQLDVFKPGTSCYECQLDEQELGIIQFRMSCPDVAQRNANFGRIATTPVSSSIIGAMQVQEALKVLYQNERQSMAGTRFKFEGMNNMFLQYKFTDFREDCESHVKWEKIIEAKELSHHTTIAELLAWVQKHYNESDPKIHLDDEVVLELIAEVSQKQYPIMKLRGHLSEKFIEKFQAVPGERIIINKDKCTSIVDKKFPKLEVSLKEIGIPPLQILMIEAGEEFHFIELTGDRDFLRF